MPQESRWAVFLIIDGHDNVSFAPSPGTPGEGVKTHLIMPRDPLAQPARIVSLDAYRGAVMLLMASAGLGLSETSAHFPASGARRFIGRQGDHGAWSGCTLWDLIQPAFMFMVGVAFPWSVASRLARGETFGRMLAHALWRASNK